MIELNNHKFHDGLILKLTNLYNLEYTDTDYYVHWCDIQSDPEQNDFYSGKISKNLDSQTIKDAQDGKAKIVFATWQESIGPSADMYTLEDHYFDVDLLLEKFCEKHNIPYDNVIWVSGDLTTEERQKSKKIKSYSYTCYGHDIMEQYNSLVEKGEWNLKQFKDRKFVKKFLCLQRWMKPGRVYWSYLMHLNNTMRKGHVSIPNRMSGYSFSEKIKQFTNNLSNYPERYTFEDLSLEHIKHIHTVLSDLNYHIPLVLDVQDADSNWCAGEDTTLSSIPYYNTSFSSVITETQIEGPGVFISEAAFRPFIYQHPAIWIGQQDTLFYLKEMGFKTWDWLLDENYDNIPSMFDRLEYAHASLQQLCLIDINNELLDKIQEQLDYNLDWMSTGFYNYQKQKLDNILKDILYK